MKTLLVYLLLLLPATAEWYRDDPQTAKLLSVDPFRRIDDKYFDLRPLFTYWLRDPLRSKQVRPPALANWQAYDLRVENVFGDLLLVSKKEGREWRSTRYVLLNYPLQTRVVDKEQITVLAWHRPDRFQYRTVRGDTATVEQFDYGIPFDPQERAKELAEKARK